MKVLALDFDGVIADSAPESFATACATWRSLEPAHPLDADVERLRAGFLSLMPLGNRAEDYGVALRILAESARVESQEDYDAFRAALDPVWLRAFHKRFYAERAARERADRAAWLGEMRPYPGIVALLGRVARRVQLAIATAKDRHSVRVLLGEWGLDALFPEGRVLDKEAGVSKAQHVERLQRELGVRFPEITFVDDKVNHLDAVAPLGARCVLAGWGYNGPREHALAARRGYPVCSLADFEARL
jgi:phosphoglycolate phosphatase-like HAD superfamily hydrolase